MSEEVSVVKDRGSLERITLELVGTTEKASRRVRYVLMVIVTASIIAFAGFWNARDFGWKNRRLELLSKKTYSLGKDENLYSRIMESDKESIKIFRDALENCDEYTALKMLITLIYSQDKYPELFSAINDSYRKSLRGYIDNEFRKVISDGSIKEDVNVFLTKLENAIDYYKPQTLGWYGAVDLLKSYRAMEEECVKTIKIPFFNIGFDVNDLGLIGGLSFVVLSMILYYSLKREYENLDTMHRFIFTNFEGKDRIDYYYLISMSQVMASPRLPAIQMEKSSVRELREGYLLRIFLNIFDKHFSKPLFFLPFVLMVAILYYDFRSRNIGMVISKFSTCTSMIGGCIFMGIIFIVTFVCFSLARKFDRKWDEIRGEVAAWIKKTEKNLGNKDFFEERKKS